MSRPTLPTTTISSPHISIKILRLPSAMPSSRYCQTAQLHTTIRSQRRQAECSPSSSSVSIFQKFLFHFSTRHHHDTYICGHLTLGGGAYSLELPISHHLVPVDERHPERAHVASASLLFSQRRTFLPPITTGAPKTQFPTISHPITYNYDPITITAFFQ